MPIYTACILLGAVDPTCPKLRMTFNDQRRYGIGPWAGTKEE